MVRNALISLAAAATLGACGGRYPAPARPTAQAETGSVSVRDAALPFRVLVAHGGAELGEDELVHRLGAAQVVCIGETHPNPHDHWAQLTSALAVAGALACAAMFAFLGLTLIVVPWRRPFKAHEGWQG